MYSTSSPARLTGRLVIVSLMLLGSSACDRDLDLLEPADFPSIPNVYTDFYGPTVGFQAFGGSKLDAVQVDPGEAFRGTNSLRVTVPSPGDPTGGYAGGAFVADVARNLTDFDALSFWVKASRTATLDVVGIGNDNSGTSRFTAEVAGQVRLSPTWTRVIVPLPDASVFTEEKGMFFFAEGAEGGVGYTIWLDEIEFVDLGTIGAARPAIPTRDQVADAGSTFQVTGTTVTYDVFGSDVVVGTSPSYFTFESSDETVAEPQAGGIINLLGSGLATITGSLGSIPAEGELTLRVAGPPTIAPPSPSRPASAVTSLFSDAYDNNAVDTWSAVWDVADVEDIEIAGEPVKRYTNMVFAGVEFFSDPVDASTREGIHMDVWVQNPDDFRVKLVDFAGGNVTEDEVFLSRTSTPSLGIGEWLSLDIPFSAFANNGLVNRSQLSQMIFSGGNSTIYVDNIYFYGDTGSASSGASER
jgi:hypothetical protein